MNSPHMPASVGGNADAPADELRMETDELLRRVGRNLINFQMIEGMLKFLLVNGGICGPIRELEAIREARSTSVGKETMGMLVGRLSDEFLSDVAGSKDIPDDITVPWLSMHVTLDAQTTLDLHRDLQALVKERNELVHHLATRWGTRSLEATQSISVELDEQREKFLPVFDRLRHMVLAMRDGIRAQAEFLASPQGKSQLETAWLCSSPVVSAMREYLQGHARADGWLPLATAGQHLHRDLPDHVSNLRQIYGHSTLRRLLDATGLFEIREEPTLRGTRTIYRLVPTMD
jgi:hypothetical protein